MAENPDITKAFAKSLRHYRQLKNMSQEQLAEAADLDRTYISMLERAVKSPTLTTMYSLSKQLGVPLSELVSHAEAQLKKFN